MPTQNKQSEYFPYGMQIGAEPCSRLALAELLAGGPERAGLTPIMYARGVAARLNTLPEMASQPVRGGLLHLYALLNSVYRYLIRHYETSNRGALEQAADRAGCPEFGGLLAPVLGSFVALFPSREMIIGAEQPEEFLAADDPHLGRRKLLAMETLILQLSAENPALDDFRMLFDDQELDTTSPYRRAITALDRQLATPPLTPPGIPLPELLRAPIKASPRSLAGQIEFIRREWRHLLPPELLTELLTAVGIAREEEREFSGGGAGQPQVLEFLKGGKLGRGGYDYPEYERFSADADWMANVVMLAKMVYVWLGQLSRQYGRDISRLDQIPDEELDRLARWGFTALWLIGVWERSQASQRIKQISGNQEAISSAYSLYDYVIAHDLGGEAALNNLRDRCRSRGIRLASDMVPNHTGIYSRWTVEHPDWFVQLDYPPYPAYRFNGPDLSGAPEVSLHIEDGYWDKRDAAVVFKHYDHRDGRTRYIYHGNDGTSTPWNDTAQLNYLLPQVREAVIGTILHVARQFPIIRFDAAMTLAKKHYQRLWYPQPGHGSGVPSRAEHGLTREEFDAAFPEEFWREVVDRVAAEAPDTLLLAEAFWLMEGYFVRTLGMHRVYNSAFMNMLKMEENAKYRQTVKNVLEYDHRILQRFVNFMNNPDERTAIEQFGREGKYFGACALLVTMPGLPMFGHGQVEGFHEKYGMEYRRACWDEPVDQHLVAAHERLIFPLMRRRWLFSGSENFVLYDFFAGSQVDEHVFAYSNRAWDARGVVLFNNRFGETAGWIRTSTAIARQRAGGETVLEHTTLGKALGFQADPAFLYSFLDCVSGLEYLRSGRELMEQGLFVTLGPYEFHAFIDFREIRDDQFGTWGRLCHHLAGQGAKSLAEEVKLIRYESVIAPFRQLLLAPAPPETAGKPAAFQPDIAPEGLALFLDRLVRFEGEATEAEALVAAVAADLEALKWLLGHQEGSPSRSRHELTDELFVAAQARLCWISWLILHRLGMLAGEMEWEERSFALADRYGLIRGVELELAGIPDAAGLEWSSLLRLALRWQDCLSGAGVDAPLARLPFLFDDPLARQFLLVHDSDGVTWFNKERFALLAQWLCLAGFVNNAAGVRDDRLLVEMAEASHEALRTLLAAAEKAGYRVDTLLVPEVQP